MADRCKTIVGRENGYGVIPYCLVLLGSVLVAVTAYLAYDAGVCDEEICSGVFRALTVMFGIGCLLKGVSQKRLLNPWLLFSLTPLSLALYNECVSDFFLSHLKPYTWLMGIFGFASFLIGLEIRRARPKVRHDDLFNQGARCSADYAIDAIVLLAMVVIGRTTGYLTAVFNLLIYPALLCALTSRHKSAIALTGLYFLISCMFSFNKSTFLSIALVLLVALESRGVAKKRVATYSIMGLLFMILVAFPLKAFMADGSSFFESFSNGSFAGFLTNSYDSSILYYEGRMNWTGFSFLMLPYFYLVTPWTNLQYVIETQPDFTWGAWALRPILGWLQLDAIIPSETYALVPMTSFNTFGFITPEYKDFGVIGVMVLSFLLGIYVRWAYNSALISDSPLAQACYALVAAATVEMFFSNHFFQQSYPFTIVIVCLVYAAGVRTLRVHINKAKKKTIAGRGC